MAELMRGLSAAVLVSFAVERAVEYFLAWPLTQVYPDLDREWLRYAVLVFAGAASWFSGWDLFADVVALDPLVSQILTAVIVGAGPEFVHRLVKEPVSPVEEVRENVSVTGFFEN